MRCPYTRACRCVRVCVQVCACVCVCMAHTVTHRADVPFHFAVFVQFVNIPIVRAKVHGTIHIHSWAGPDKPIIN